MTFTSALHATWMALLLVPLGAAAAAADQHDAAGNRLEALQLQTGAAQNEVERYCTTDGHWCLQALASAGEDQPAALEVAERVPGEAEPRLRHVAIDTGDEGDLRVWPYIVRMAPGIGADQPLTDPQQATLQNVLVGGLVEVRTMYSGGGASASTLQLARIRHLDEGVQVDDNILHLPLDANAMIRACFSEDDFKQRAGACHDEYGFEATLTLIAEGQGMPVLRYQTVATDFPAGVSRQRDSLAMGRLKKKDLRTVQDPTCSYTRVFRFSNGAYQPENPLPECSDYTRL